MTSSFTTPQPPVPRRVRSLLVFSPEESEKVRTISDRLGQPFATCARRLAVAAAEVLLEPPAAPAASPPAIPCRWVPPEADRLAKGLLSALRRQHLEEGTPVPVLLAALRQAFDRLAK